MSKPFHSPKPENTNEAENKISSNISSQSETTETAKNEIKATFTPDKNHDAEMESKFGKDPSEQKIVEYFTSQAKKKRKNYQEILLQLEKDENKPMAERLKKKVKWNIKQLNSENAASATDAEIDAYLIDRWFDGKKKIAPKTADANKVKDMSGFNIASTKVRLKAGDLILGQTSSSWENLVFRIAPVNPSERRYISISHPGASASEEKIKELKTQYTWYEVNEKDIDQKEVKNTIIDAPQKKTIIDEAKKTEAKPVVETQHVTSLDKAPENKQAKSEEPKKEAKVKKSWKVDINPLNRARHLWTRVLSWVGGFTSRVSAKINATLARPQDIFYGKYRTDIGKNIIRTPKAIAKTISGTFYKPHRDGVQFEDVYKWYGPTRWPNTQKYKIKKVPRFVGKFLAPFGGVLPKFGANLGRWFNHLVHETFEAVKESKRHRNPKNRNLKTFKYSKTKEAVKRAFSWNKEPEVMAERKKAA